MNSQQVKKKNLSLTLVKPVSNSHLDKFKRLSRAETEIDYELSQLGDLRQVQQVGEIIHLICNLVENLSSVKLTGQEKKDFVIKKLLNINPVFNNESDLKWIGNIIDTLVLVGAISKIPKSLEVIQGVKSVCSGFFSK